MNQNSYYLQKKYLADTYVNRGLDIVRGEGVYLFDANGDRYLDMMSNYGVNLFGYGDSKINKALTAQLKQLTTLHSSFNNEIRSAAIEKLVERTNSNLKKVYLANSGSEAIEAALKFSVVATGKKKFIRLKSGFHGKTLGSLSATGTRKHREIFEPLLWNFVEVVPGDLVFLEKSFDNSIAGVLLETVQGEGGVNIVDVNFLREIREFCDKYKALMVVDEIQTGLGRTGKFLSIEESDVKPDIITLGKGLAGGVPIGATLISMNINRALSKGIHTSTFGGNPFACAGIIATLDLIDDKLLSHVQGISKYFEKELKAFVKQENLKIKGLMIGIEVGKNRDLMLKELQKEHILAIPSSEGVLRLLPPLIITKTHVDEFISSFRNIYSKHNV